MGLGKDFVVMAYVRITSQNNQIRIDRAAAPAETVTLTTGVYPLGYGSGNPDSALDSASFGTSFLEQLATDFSGSGGWGFALQTQQCTTIAQSATGHIFIDAAATDQILWTHEDTTADPRWFGLPIDPATNRAPADTTFATSTWEDISSFCSSLCFISEAGIMRDLSDENTAKQNTQAATGKGYSATFTPTIHVRDLTYQLEGLIRTGTDGTVNRMRRFLASLRESGANGRFLYIPDEENFGEAWSPDESTAAHQYGYQVFEADSELSWSQSPTNEPYQGLWEAGLVGRQYIGS